MGSFESSSSGFSRLRVGGPIGVVWDPIGSRFGGKFSVFWSILEP